MLPQLGVAAVFAATEDDCRTLAIARGGPASARDERAAAVAGGEVSVLEGLSMAHVLAQANGDKRAIVFWGTDTDSS